MNPLRMHQRTALATAACLLGLSTPLLALAQSTTAAGTPTTQPEEGESQEPSSTEQGQTPLDESFGPLSHDAWVRETRRKAWEDTKWAVQLRTYYLDRDKYDDTQSEAWALGGSVGFKTGYFRERFSIGSTLYTSQELHGPEDKDGTLLLAPGQEGYTVLGELYGEVLFTQDVRMTLGARGFDTPYINRNDSRMTPNTFLAGAVQGLHNDETSGGEWRWGAGYFDKIKERNDDEFVSMSEDAGADIERGVFAGGLNYKRDDFSIGAINYWSSDIINIFYTEAKYAIPITDTMKLRMAAQFSDQQSVGDAALTGAEFSAHQWGAKTELVIGPALLTLAYTSADGDANMQNPWSGYPGYTSVQVEDFNRDGEDAWMFRAGYDLQAIKGLSLYALYVDGDTPDSPTQFGRSETDFNVQWVPPDGPLKGLMARVRYAEVETEDPGDSDLTDLRVMVYYDLQL